VLPSLLVGVGSDIRRATARLDCARTFDHTHTSVDDRHQQIMQHTRLLCARTYTHVKPRQLQLDARTQLSPMSGNANNASATNAAKSDAMHAKISIYESDTWE
jgi:hypothetical protein